MPRHRRVTRHYRRIFRFFAPFLKLLPWVSPSENGTFRQPEAVLGNNGADYLKTGRMVTLAKYHNLSLSLCVYEHDNSKSQPPAWMISIRSYTKTADLYQI
ncbi:hypothetical protein AVEN_9219-1 [Araneus ventricosus]|uniref:Uncharacterized protein n=1 Tax=Araneus ventricosus TaxID=182803 RepID=A0A4Y2TJM8_ARAVE|nr:hypothetical protein AVEN_9219-1 [Araneus ventricosus]